MEDISIALVWLGFFASLFFGWYFYLQARNKERMALIEKNADLSEIFKPREIRFRFPWLKIGMIITGAGLGLFLGVLIEFIPGLENIVRNTEGAAVFALIFLFGGIGIIISYFIDKPKNR
jgi:hypothetical protein